MFSRSLRYAEFSGSLRRTLEKWGDYGKVVLPDLLHISRGAAVVVLAVLLTAALFALEKFTVR